MFQQKTAKAVRKFVDRAGDIASNLPGSDCQALADLFGDLASDGIESTTGADPNTDPDASIAASLRSIEVEFRNFQL